MVPRMSALPCIVTADSEVSRCWTLKAGRRVFTPDKQDRELLAERASKRAARKELLDGDYVEFADGVKRRVSHITNWDGGRVQTSDVGGSWYLFSTGGASYSGGLYGSVHRDTLTDTGRTEPARFWFFHREFRTAHHAVYVEVNVRVWASTANAPR